MKMSWKNVSEIPGHKFWSEKQAKISGQNFWPEIFGQVCQKVYLKVFITGFIFCNEAKPSGSNRATVT